MKLTYDPQHNIAYIKLRDSAAPVETIHVSDELNVDLSPDGTVYGIELLNANEQLSRGGAIAVENTVTGGRVEIAWPEDAA